MSRAPLTITCYHHDVPSFALDALDRLYGGRYCCASHFQIYGLAHDTCTYVARRSGELVSVFLFRLRGASAIVLNEGMRVGAEEAGAFARYLFAHYRAATALRFRMIEDAALALALPAQRCRGAQESMLVLPPSAARYLEGLGTATRANLKRYRALLARDFPAMRFELLRGPAVSAEQVGAIVALNRERMRRKGKRSSIDAREEQCILAYVRECGLAGLASVDGRVCAGLLIYRAGRDFSARIVAHDPAYDRYRLGLLCFYFSICACIAHGAGARLYFGWGMDEYKRHLGGRPRQLGHLAIYRSRVAMARHPVLVLRMALARPLALAGQALRDAADGGHPLLTPLARVGRAGVRRLRQGAARLGAWARPP
ncbi:MAG: GNAT family N-acetyltransferase [Pseudomonadota bacterium]